MAPTKSAYFNKLMETLKTKYDLGCGSGGVIRAFNYFDTPRSVREGENTADVACHITLQEFINAFQKKTALKELNFTDAEVTALFREFDSSDFADDKLFLPEFQEAVNFTMTEARRRFLAVYFRELNKSADGAAGDSVLDVKEMEARAKRNAPACGVPPPPGAGGPPGVPPPPSFESPYASMIKRAEIMGETDGKVTLKEFQAGCINQSQREPTDDAAFAARVMNTWELKIDYKFEKCDFC